MIAEIVRDEWITKTTLRTETNEEWALDYYLQTFDGEDGGTLYGLKVAKGVPDNEPTEWEETGAVTESRDEALTMLHAFAHGSVTPMALIEIADDWLSQCTEC
ncbi:MAG: DUF6514 family protein [Defluviitaleaceae bacterium]|nr:DUF6514 family protein [Defluviitaleaceae bacterium]